jgi:hypothetical protein
MKWNTTAILRRQLSLEKRGERGREGRKEGKCYEIKRDKFNFCAMRKA